ncbi:MAG: hypothetical protein WDN45_12305 [Caulobacteraceae bacterium]
MQITAGTRTRQLLKEATPHGQVPVIRSQKSTLADLLEGGGTVLQRSVEALDRVNRLLSDANLKTVSGTLDDVHRPDRRTARTARHHRRRPARPAEHGRDPAEDRPAQRLRQGSGGRRRQAHLEQPRRGRGPR